MALKRKQAIEFLVDWGQNPKLITIHPQYHEQTISNDVALLKIPEISKFSKSIRPICMPKTDDFLKSVELTISGWGFKHHSEIMKYGTVPDSDILPDILQHVNINYVETKKCIKAYRKMYRKFDLSYYRQFCAYGIDYNQKDQTTGKNPKIRDSCNADSGGPIFVRSKYSGHPILVGIVSFGPQCPTEGVPGVYVRISFYKKWINEIVGEELFELDYGQ